MDRPTIRRARSAAIVVITTVVAFGVLVAVAPPAGAGAPASLPSGTTVTMVIPGVVGAGSTAGHDTEAMELHSFSWGASNHAIVITKSVDRASPSLIVAAGHVFATVTYYLDGPASPATGATGSAVAMMVRLQRVTVTQVPINWSDTGGDRPVETLTMSYSSAPQVTYQDASGTY